MLRALWCRLLRHRHGQTYILVTMRDGGAPLKSHLMDEWSAEWIVANVIMPTAMFAGRPVASCRIVVL